MPLDIGFVNDFDVADNIESVLLVPVGQPDTVRARARRRAVRRGEAEVSGGAYSLRDSVFTFLKCEVSAPPLPGSLIYTEYRDELWHVYELFNTVHRTRYQCFARKGFLESELDEVADIQVNEGGKDTHGAPYKRWGVLLAQHPVKVQEIENSIATDDNRTMVSRGAQIYIATDKNLEAGMRVVVSGGKTWNVTQVTGKGEIGMLQVLDVEEARTPGAR